LELFSYYKSIGVIHRKIIYEYFDI
jgi:hypothetical protein